MVDVVAVGQEMVEALLLEVLVLRDLMVERQLETTMVAVVAV
jgi:hypothetical protein